MKLPQYQCHKVVRAAKITGWLGNEENGYDVTGDGHTVIAHVAANWIDKHNPSVGGYYVLYEDGYASYSTAKAFEEGYTKVEMVPTPQGQTASQSAPDRTGKQYTARPYSAGFDVDKVFTYHSPKADQPERYVMLRELARSLAGTIISVVPDSPERTLALRDLQRCVMMANGAIAINEA